MQQKTQQLLKWAFWITLVLWGAYTLFFYLGMPVHRASLLADADTGPIDTKCSWAFCQGVLALWPFLKEFVVRTEPFLWYIVASVIIYAIFAGVLWLKSPGRTIRFSMRPWHIALGFLLSVWLLFTVFSFGTQDGMSMKTIVQPTADVYKGVTQQTLQLLQDNFNVLESHGCLTKVGDAAVGAGIYEMKGICFQASFFTRVVSQMLVVMGLLFLLLIAGHTLLRVFRLTFPSRLAEGVLSLGLGAGVMIAALWFLALIGAYTLPVGWALMIAILVLCAGSALYWIKVFLFHEWEVEIHFADIRTLLLWLLVSYLALNFLTVVRPFPIGWDDLGSYINRPRILVSYGAFTYSMLSFQWEYLTSLGFLLFDHGMPFPGYTSPFAATAAMMINWSEGLLVVLMTFVFARTFLGPKRGLLATLLLYTLPLIGHFSFADMKIDNAVLFMSGISAYTAFLALFHNPESLEQPLPATWKERFLSPTSRMLLLAGVLGGLAFSFKITAVMGFLGLLAILAGAYLGAFASVAFIFFAFAAFAMQGVLDLSRAAGFLGWAGPILTGRALALILFLIGALALVHAIRKHSRELALRTGVGISVLLIGFILACVPWMLHNGYVSGSFPLLRLGAPNPTQPVFVLNPATQPTPTDSKNIHVMPQELAVDMSNPACHSTAQSEELDRYWGSGKGIMHYLTLPWRTVMNADIGGYYVTTIPALLLFPLLLLIPLFWEKEKKWLRALALWSFFILLQWAFLANGVPWYGVAIFLGLALSLEAMLVISPDRKSRITMSILLGASLLLALGMRFWQFDMQKNLLEYPLGKINAAALEQRTIPYYSSIAQIVTDRHMQLKDQPFVYRVGTFIPYFIPRSTEVQGVADQQLDFFHCLAQGNDPALTLKRLIALGFNSVIFDTNTATIERDQNGSLHKKVDEFVNFLNTAGLGTSVLVNDVQAGIAFILLPPIQ